MSWAARFVDDGARLRRVRLNALQGERDALQHKRDLLRVQLANALTVKDVELSRALSGELETISQTWLSVIGQIRQLKETAR